MECLSPSHTLLLKPLSLSLLGKPSSYSTCGATTTRCIVLFPEPSIILASDSCVLANVQDGTPSACDALYVSSSTRADLCCSVLDTAFTRSMSCQQQIIFQIIKPINAHYLDFSSKITTLQNMLLIFGNVDVFQACISFQ